MNADEIMDLAMTRPPTDTPEAIVRALADRWTSTPARDAECPLCDRRDDDRIDRHSPRCLFRRAVEWVAEHPEER